MATLRNTARDRKAALAIAAVCAVAVAGVAVSAPIHRVTHTVAEAPASLPAEAAAVPGAVVEAWSQEDTSAAFTPKPLPVDGVVAIPQGTGVIAVDPATGEVRWRYERRGMPLCSLSTSFGAVQAVFEGREGCGEVTSLAAQTGQYRATRAARNAESVAPVISNDSVGTVSPHWVELWRSDLVRTLEYGTNEVPQEPGMQPHEGCEITAALTRKGNVAVSERCPEDPETSHVRLMKAVPEDSRKPELSIEIDLKGQGHVVAISETHSAVYLESPSPRLYSFDAEGTLVGDRAVAPAPNDAQVEGRPAMYQYIADLPHHMSWFDGERLYLFDPETLEVAQVFEGAIGTGAAMAGRLLVPVADGIAVANWSTGEVERVIPVTRDSTGPVSLAVVGDTILEQRDIELVALRPA
ncbi:hypothetical protein C1Y63_06365 [Corynebacterium sp. 13CS0277]|uniref:Rv3212 family protein n=1 Tax=Corynebacterium sp. 13CS0277 TaxID=2071994 RepID=UPI000D02A4D8|nr:PQQ-binding-like beta-propeller repeat protein [Corynebacterium sp. 13CS0277]PRQ11464.1 hypothetical protein C1Y63_06365 [Corynebacterium sp. 13CS0277]